MEQVLPEGKLDADILRKSLERLPTAESIVIGPRVGVDAGVIKTSSDYLSVAVDPITFTTRQIGVYSVAVNINDLVCQGFRPVWYSTSLLLPVGTTRSQLEIIWEDLVEALEQWNIAVVAGHTEITDGVNRPLLAGQMLGVPLQDLPLDPANANPGEGIYQWRPAALEGLALLACEFPQAWERLFPELELSYFQNLLNEPGICVWPAARELFSTAMPSALHDPTEGGIATALHELAEVAGTGLVVEQNKIVWPDHSEEIFQKIPVDPLGLLSSGCLLVVYSEKQYQKLGPAVRENLRRLGRLTANPGIYMLDSSGNSRKLPKFTQDQLLKGFDFFKADQ